MSREGLTVTSKTPRPPYGGGLLVLLLMLATGATACAVPGRPIAGSTAGAATESLNASDVLADVGAPHRELQQLDRLPETAYVRLRRNLVLISTGATDRAVRDLNQILFGAIAPTENVRALAHYVRARAFLRRNDADRARYDFEQAARLTADPALRDRVTADLADGPWRRTPTAAVARTAFLGRGEWRAASSEPSMTRMGRIHRATVHHSAVLARSGSQRAAAAAVRAIQRTHMQGNGWSDIGYHFLIDRAGRVWTGRPIEWQGAHAGDAARNRGNVGVCLLGNFVAQGDGQTPSAEQIVALENLLTQFARDYGIAADDIYTHRELRSTSCPGERLQQLVNSIRRRFDQARLAAPRAP